jgi:hypothetical protein
MVSVLAAFASNTSAMGNRQTLRHFLGLGIVSLLLKLAYANYTTVCGICQSPDPANRVLKWQSDVYAIIRTINIPSVVYSLMTS